MVSDILLTEGWQRVDKHANNHVNIDILFGISEESCKKADSERCASRTGLVEPASLVPNPTPEM